MISGSFTLINEAVRLNFWPKVKIKYSFGFQRPTYIPSLNLMLWIGCLIVILSFQKSSNMEAAYGLATIVLTMLMTTLLFTYYMIMKKYKKIFIILFTTTYLVIESAFLVANLS